MAAVGNTRGQAISSPHLLAAAMRQTPGMQGQSLCQHNRRRSRHCVCFGDGNELGSLREPRDHWSRLYSICSGGGGDACGLNRDTQGWLRRGWGGWTEMMPVLAGESGVFRSGRRPLLWWWSAWKHKAGKELGGRRPCASVCLETSAYQFRCFRDGSAVKCCLEHGLRESERARKCA
jgi:hypothetical protein